VTPARSKAAVQDQIRRGVRVTLVSAGGFQLPVRVPAARRASNGGVATDGPCPWCAFSSPR